MQYITAKNTADDIVRIVEKLSATENHGILKGLEGNGRLRSPRQSKLQTPEIRTSEDISSILESRSTVRRSKVDSKNQCLTVTRRHVRGTNWNVSNGNTTRDSLKTRVPD